MLFLEKKQLIFLFHVPAARVATAPVTVESSFIHCGDDCNTLRGRARLEVHATQYRQSTDRISID